VGFIVGLVIAEAVAVGFAVAFADGFAVGFTVALVVGFTDAFTVDLTVGFGDGLVVAAWALDAEAIKQSASATAIFLSLAPI
jgi:hypothetical protein